jgi:hypothetical protein
MGTSANSPAKHVISAITLSIAGSTCIHEKEGGGVLNHRNCV